MAGKMAYLSKEEKQKIRNALKIKKSLDKEEDNHNLRASSPESEEVDFKKVIHPLSYYIHDREQMMEEIFSIIKGDKLRKMLPPLLKNCTLEEIKADCLVHLLGMSKKRILAIIEGRELHSSSDSESESSTTNSEPDEPPKSPANKVDVDDDDLLDISISEKDIDSLMKDKSNTTNKPKKPKTRMRKKIKTEKDVSLFSIVISDDDLDDQSGKKAKKINRERTSSKLDKILGNKGKKRRKSHSKSTVNVTTGEGSNDQTLDENGAASLDKNDKGKTLLEILELEMRARAIRALLKNTNDVEEGNSALSDAVKSTTDAATKSDPKIVSAIAEAIDQSLADKTTTDPPDDSDADDVEIIDDIDLCVLIDDDDDMETNSEVPAPQANTNETCDPQNDSEKEKPVAADSSKNSLPSNDEAKKGEDSSKSNPPTSESEERPTDDSENIKASNNNLETDKPATNEAKKSKPAQDNMEKSTPVSNNSEKRKPSDGAETRIPSQDDAKKRKHSKDDSRNRKSSDHSEKSEPAVDLEKSKLSPIPSEKLKTLITPNPEKPVSSVENAEKCESPIESDSNDRCDLTKDDTSEPAGELKSEPSGEVITSTDSLTWSERWAEKQNVKEVVRNSKICANIRKRMRFARMLKQKQSEESSKKVDNIDIGNVEESSVAHYNLIKAHASKSVDSGEYSRTAGEQDAAVETSQEAPENETDADITTADHTLTILESDPKMLIIDISDDEVIPESPSKS